MLSYAPPTAYPAALVDTRERTASRTSTKSFRRLHESIARSAESSEFFSRLRAFEDLVRELAALRFTEPNWNSYGSPKPSADSIQAAGILLDTLRRHDILAAKVLPSAEGGVAIAFTSNTPNRALIEALNDGERFLLLYTRSGDSETIDLASEPQLQAQPLTRLKLHLRGTSLATS